MGQMKNYIFFLLLLSAMISFQVPVLAKEVTLEFWNGFTGQEGRGVQKIVNAFNEEQQGKIRVNMVVMSWNDFYGKLALAVHSERGPDIGVVHYDNVNTVIYQGIALELDPYLDRFPKEDFVKSVWEVSDYNSHHYGIPLDVIPFAFYWNKDIFKAAGLDPEKPPSNRAEFLAACEKISQANLTKNGQKVWPFMVPCTWPHFIIWQHVFFCNGGQLFSNDFKKPIYDSPAGEDALNFLQELISKYNYSPPNVMGLPANEGKESFCRGTCAMLLEGPWMLSSFEEIPNLNYGAIAAINLGTGQHRIWASGHTIIILKKRFPDPVKIKASLAFVEYLSTHSIEWARTNQIPARYSILASKEFKEIPYLHQIAKDVDKFAFPKMHYRYTEGVQPLVDEYLNLCLIGKISAHDAMIQAAREGTIQLQQDPD
jgi:multiple sugar transport system substrate-binding protein